MKFERNPFRELPDGSLARVFPFHISFSGTKERVLCRKDNDYDIFIKMIHICAYKRNVIVIIYTVVSNHAHIVVLAR